MFGNKEESSEYIPYPKKSDIQLVELILAGDEIAFEQIFIRYKRLVTAGAARYFLQPQQIEEMVQSIFVKVYTEIEDFQGGHDFSMASWLGRITTNACLDALRSQKRKPVNSYGELSDEEVKLLVCKTSDSAKSAENCLVERDLAEKLLSHLPAEDQALLKMFYIEQLSVKEISELTGWSKSKIKIRVFRSRNALRKVLRKYL